MSLEDQNEGVDFGFEDAAVEVIPEASEVTNHPAPPLAVSGRRPDEFDMTDTATGLVRRCSTSVSANWWEMTMREKGRYDEIGDAFLQSPPPDEPHYMFATNLLQVAGANHQFGCWGLLLVLAGKELVPTGDQEIDLGVISQPLTVPKSLIVDLSDFLVLTAHSGVEWWKPNSGMRNCPEKLSQWGGEFAARVNEILPSLIPSVIAFGSNEEHSLILRQLTEASNPDDPKLWSYTRLGASLNALQAPPLEEIISTQIKKDARVQFSAEQMIKWLDQVHRGMSLALSRMTPEKRSTFDTLNQQVRAELTRRSADTQKELLQKWTQRFKITN